MAGLLVASPAAHRPPTLVVVGDSIGRGGYLADEHDRWGDQLDGYDVTVAARGGSSATARRWNETRRWVEWWSTVMTWRPDVLVIGLGTNDVGLVPPESICHALGWFVSSSLERGIDARVLTVPPTNGAQVHEADRLEVNACLRATIPNGHLVDLRPVFGDVLAPELDIGDGVHPNEAGHRLIAEVVAASL